MHLMTSQNITWDNMTTYMIRTYKKQQQQQQREVVSRSGHGRSSSDTGCRGSGKVVMIATGSGGGSRVITGHMGQGSKDNCTCISNCKYTYIIYIIYILLYTIIIILVLYLYNLIHIIIIQYLPTYSTQNWSTEIRGISTEAKMCAFSQRCECFS